MARRKKSSSAAAEEEEEEEDEDEEECPTLKLIMEKGPPMIYGQSFEFRPGSVIRIGRIVRGNSVTIKDAGISSNHLLIQQLQSQSQSRSQSQSQSQSQSRCSSWTITDLASSNGTILNGAKLPPSQPALLSHGDILKIGEQTSILVRFQVTNNNTTATVRRNARRRVRNQVPELGVIHEDSELGLVDKHLDNDNYMKDEDLGNQGRSLGTFVEEKVRGGRRTRGSVAGESGNGIKDVDRKIESLGQGRLRRTRTSKKEEHLEISTAGLDEDEEKSDKGGEAEVVKQGTSMSLRRTRSNSKNNDNLLEDLNIKDLEPSGVKGVERVITRRTRSSRKDENIGEIGIDLSVIENKRTRKGTRGRKKAPLELPLEGKKKDESDFEYNMCEEERRKSEAVGDGGLVEEGVNSGREGGAGLASTSGVKDCDVEVGNGEVVAVLEKMTLGEWFDFLEVSLPKQIIDATEEMISEMTQKAERLKEFMLQQKNAKEKGEVAAD